ncbi:hypothetical protein LTR04_001300 [Oleoguttula sp. CCFEE 6159]|nr:hypothetical protein LTR04_001300 [Oleoguttula sp. CCFEE 6159]
MGRGKSCLTLPAENLSDDDEGKLERDDTAGGIFESEDLRKGKYEMKHEYEPSDNWGPDTMPLGRADPKLSKTPDVPKEQRFCCLRRGPSEAHKPGKKADKERKRWYEEYCLNGDENGLDPYRWSVLDVNDKLVELNTKMFGGST